MRRLKPVMCVMLLAAGPALASAQLGFMPLPETKYRSTSRCERALTRLEQSRREAPQPPQREVSREGATVRIVEYEGAEWRTYSYECRGSTMIGYQGGGIAQTVPPQISR